MDQTFLALSKTSSVQSAGENTGTSYSGLILMLPGCANASQAAPTDVRGRKVNWIFIQKEHLGQPTCMATVSSREATESQQEGKAQNSPGVKRPEMTHQTKV